jgi:hypothetical protein
MVVLGHFVVLLVLNDLQYPETNGENGKRYGNDCLQRRNPRACLAPIFNWHGRSPRASLH